MHELAVLADLYERGMREPLPLACLSSAAYALAGSLGQDAMAAARAEWETEWRHEREDRDLEHQLAFGGVLAFEALLVQPELPGGPDEDWESPESTRFGRYARRLWDGLLEAEQVTAR
jgi:exodeoxyribonuclease V gamma subunit